MTTKNPIYTQNIVYCAFDEQFDYEYNKEYDVIFVNIVNGINEESILKASIERTLHLLGISDINSPKVSEALNLSKDSELKESDIRYLFFNDNNIKRQSIIDQIIENSESFIKVQQKIAPLLENRDSNFEPVNIDSIYNLKQGDLVQLGEGNNAFYTIFLEYYINAEGKYIMKTISANSTYPEKIELKTPEIRSRKQSSGSKFSEYEIAQTADYYTIKLPKDLYFNNKILFDTVKRGDKITIGRTDYLILNQKGAIYIVKDNKGEISELKPTNTVNSIKLNSKIHTNTTYKGENLETLFTESPIINNSDRNYILENDVVEYDNKLGIVIVTMNENLYVKDLKTNEIEKISKYSVSKHYINNVGNSTLILSLKENKNVLSNFDPFNYGDYLESDFSWITYYEGLSIRKGDYLIINNKPYVIIDENNESYRVNDGTRYLFINKSSLENSLIATKRKQDPKLANTSINKNSYYVSNNPNQYTDSYEAYPVKIIYNKNTGETRVNPSDKEIKSHYIDKSSEFKKDKGFSENDVLYAFKKSGIAVRNSEQTVFIPNSFDNFARIFEYLIPGTFVRFNSKDLKYWMIEKQIGDKFLISHSYYRNGEIKTVKKFLNKNDKVFETRLPHFASKTLETINNVLGIKESKEINPLKEYQSTEILIAMKSLLDSKFGINIQFVTSKDSNLKAYTSNGEYFINTDKASISDPLHEFLHIVLASMKFSNPKEYRTMVESVSSHPLFSEVSLNYQEANLDILEETFIRLFSQTVTHEISQSGVFTEDSFNNAVKLGITNMLGLSTSLEDEYSYELLDTELKEILTKFGSSLIENSDSLYNKENSINMIATSSTIRQLLKSGELKEECNG